MDKRKTYALTMSAIMAAAILGGCSSSASGSSKTSYAGKTIYGDISSISGSRITIELEVAKPGSSTSTSGSISSVDATDLTPVGKSKTVKITSDTELTKLSTAASSSTSASGGGGGSSSGGTPPAKPTGSSSSSSSIQNVSTSAGSSSAVSNTASTSSGSSSSSSEIDTGDLSKGDDVAVKYDDDGKVESVTVIHSGSGAVSGITYTAAKTYTSDKTVSGKTVKSTGADENAIHALGAASIKLSDMKIIRDSSSSSGGDNASFYGLSSALLESEGSTYIADSRITTDADGGAGLFAYGEGVIYASDTKIKTSNGASGGIHVAGGGTIYAWDLDVETSGQSSAAIRSDRGGGTEIVDGGTYTSNGTGSPAIYSTANVAVHNAKLKANGSEAVCIEGKNSVRLYDCDLTGNMKDDSQNDCTWNVILYQSMSGDSETGNSVFSMKGGSITAKNGGMFYTTNTQSTFVLDNVNIKYAKDNDYFFKATGNSNQRGWGTAGSNGADTSFTAIDQKMKGDVIWDSTSQVDFYMTDGSTLSGAVVDDESNAGSGGSGYCSLYISKDSTWTVTGNSTVTNLYNAGTIKDKDGNKVTIKGTDGTVYVKGSSKYTVTVTKYSRKADTSRASSITKWSKFSIKKPSALEND